MNRLQPYRCSAFKGNYRYPPCSYCLFYADNATKQDTAYHYDEIASNKEEYILLKRFRILNSIKRKAILQLISDPNERF
ncbi:hypothetical protein ABID23_000654 [Bartonella silvatica]|uniref:Uncharacterized protein n=1 Tax=Bartonella silvatica TaxID=357760 RepID=A0ABV2HG92_9HYPH